MQLDGTQYAHLQNGNPHYGHMNYGNIHQGAMQNSFPHHNGIQYGDASSPIFQNMPNMDSYKKIHCDDCGEIHEQPVKKNKMPDPKRNVRHENRRNSLPASFYNRKKHQNKSKHRSGKRVSFMHRMSEESIASSASTVDSLPNSSVRNFLHDQHVSINLRHSGTNRVLLSEDIFVSTDNRKTLSHIFQTALERHPHEVGKYILRREKSVKVYGSRGEVHYAKPSAIYANVSEWKPKRLIFCVNPNFEVISKLEARNSYFLNINFRAGSNETFFLDEDIEVEAPGLCTVQELWDSLAGEHHELIKYSPIALLTKRPKESMFIRFGMKDQIVDVVKIKGRRFFFLMSSLDDVNHTPHRHKRDYAYHEENKDESDVRRSAKAKSRQHQSHQHANQHKHERRSKHHDQLKRRHSEHSLHSSYANGTAPYHKGQRQNQSSYVVRFNPFHMFRKSSDHNAHKTVDWKAVQV